MEFPLCVVNYVDFLKPLTFALYSDQHCGQCVMDYHAVNVQYGIPWLRRISERPNHDVYGGISERPKHDV